MVDEFGVLVAVVRERDDVIEDLMGVRAAGTDAADADDGGIPDLVRVDFGGRDVVAVAYPLNEGLHHAALIFERVAAGDGQGEAADADDHKCIGGRLNTSAVVFLGYHICHCYRRVCGRVSTVNVLFISPRYG